MSYIPDVWTIVKIESPEHGKVYKVLAGWYGGFAGSDEWKLNSGIESYVQDTKTGEISFRGFSGSVYVCHPNTERFSGLTASIYKRFEDDCKDRGMTFEHIPYESFVTEFSN